MARYHRDGFLAIVDFVSPEACAALLERATEIVAAFEPGDRPTTFRTDGEQVGDRELLASGAGIWCFFEPDAVGSDGSLASDTASSINKIGHAMHDLDPVFEAFTLHPRAGHRRCRHRAHRPAGRAEHVPVQAAAHRRRGPLPPGRHRSCTPIR